MQFLIRVLVVVGCYFFLCVSAASASEDQDFKNVELDAFIVHEKEAGKDKKLIKMAVPLQFSAKMKRFPEERKLSYIYIAMELAGVDPLPEVNHRMFIESEEGRIIPVYIEKEAVRKVKAGLKEEDTAQFLGYHIYSYSKGPAILVVDYIN